VDALLRDAASDDYSVREAARARLERIAGRARPLLEARREDPDPEVRRTVESLLEGMGASEPPTPAPGALGRLGLVDFRSEGPLAEALARWEREVGGRVQLAGEPPVAPAKVAVEGAPYFRALGDLLAASGLDVPEGFDEAGQAQAAARRDPAAPPGAASGPFRLDCEAVTTTRTFRPGVRPRHSLSLRLLWSPQVQVPSFQTPEVVRAVDERGGAFRGADGRGATYGLGGGRRLAGLQLTLDPEEGTEGDRVAVLEVSMRIRARHAPQEVVFGALAGEQPWPRSQTVPAADGRGATKVTLESFGPDPEREGWAMGVVTAVLARGVPPESVGAAVQTADGGRRALVELGSRVAGSDGVLRLTVRAPGLDGSSPPEAVRVFWWTREDDFAVPFRLENIPLR
jgi:hypothetical protein